MVIPHQIFVMLETIFSAACSSLIDGSFPMPGFRVVRWRELMGRANFWDKPELHWSEITFSVRLNHVHQTNRAKTGLQTFFAVMLRNGNVSGYLDARHIIVSRYSLPDFDFGKGPTQSTWTLENTSPKTGIDCSGALGTNRLGFPNFVSDAMVTEIVIKGQKRCLTIFSRVFLWTICDPTISDNVLSS